MTVCKEKTTDDSNFEERIWSLQRQHNYYAMYLYKKWSVHTTQLKQGIAQLLRHMGVTCTSQSRQADNVTVKHCLRLSCLTQNDILQSRNKTAGLQQRRKVQKRAFFFKSKPCAAPPDDQPLEWIAHTAGGTGIRDRCPSNTPISLFKRKKKNRFLRSDFPSETTTSSVSFQKSHRHRKGRKNDGITRYLKQCLKCETQPQPTTNNRNQILFSFSSDKERKTDSRIRRKKHSAAPPGIEPKVLRILVALTTELRSHNGNFDFHQAVWSGCQFYCIFVGAERNENLIRNRSRQERVYDQQSTFNHVAGAETNFSGPLIAVYTAGRQRCQQQTDSKVKLRQKAVADVSKRSTHEQRMQLLLDLRASSGQERNRQQ